MNHKNQILSSVGISVTRTGMFSSPQIYEGLRHRDTDLFNTIDKVTEDSSSAKPHLSTNIEKKKKKKQIRSTNYGSTVNYYTSQR